MPAYPARSKVAKRQTWNAESVFESPHLWDMERQRLLADLDSVKKFSGRLREGPAVVAEALNARDQLIVRAQRVYMYASFASAVDTTDQAAAGMQGKAGSMLGQVAAAVAFIAPELLEI